MSKKIIGLVLLFFIINIANSQALWIFLLGDKVSTEKFQMGTNISLAYTNLEGLKDATYRLDWAFGGFAEVKITDKWSFQPEMMIKGPAGAKNIYNYELESPLIDTLFSNRTTHYRFTYFSLPFFMKYKTKFIGFGFGPQVSVMYKGRSFFEGKTKTNYEYKIEKRLTKEKVNMFDVGVTAMIEYYLFPKKKLMSMRISLKYYYGFLSPLKNETDINNSIFMLTWGIPIGDETKINNPE
jgi:hypothetical protein